MSNANKGDLRVWWIPQIPMVPFHVPVSDIKTAEVVLNCLAQYDLFQLKHKVKPDFCNVGGLEQFDPADIDPDEGCDGWTEWCDEETGDSIDEYMRNKEC